MGYATILGLDLGKFKSVCCAMDIDTRDSQCAIRRAPGRAQRRDIQNKRRDILNVP